MQMLCRIKEEGKEEWLEEIPSHVGNYTIICCNSEISFKLDKEKQEKRCKECGKIIGMKIEEYITCVR